MQQAGNTHIGDPCLLCGELRNGNGGGERFSTDRVLADGLERRVAIDRQSEHAGDVALDGNGEIQLLVLDQVAIRDIPAATGYDAALNGKLIFGYAEPLGG